MVENHTSVFLFEMLQRLGLCRHDPESGGANLARWGRPAVAGTGTGQDQPTAGEGQAGQVVSLVVGRAEPADQGHAPTLADPVLYGINTGCREQEICQLRWNWEVAIPELETSVFILPEELTKTSTERVVVLNAVAKRVVESRRRIHDDFVYLPWPSDGQAQQYGLETGVAKSWTADREGYPERGTQPSSHVRSAPAECGGASGNPKDAARPCRWGHHAGSKSCPLSELQPRLRTGFGGLMMQNPAPGEPTC